MNAYQNNTEKRDKLAEYFASKYNTEDLLYEGQNSGVVRFPLNNGSKIIKSSFDIYTGKDNDYYDSVCVALLSGFCPYNDEVDKEVSFQLMKGADSFKFDYLNDFHAKEFFCRLKRHLKLLNIAGSMQRKHKVANFETKEIKVTYFYRYSYVRRIVSQCAIITFKAVKGFPDVTINVLNDDHKFLIAMDEMEKEFQQRYYDGIVDRKMIERGKFFNRQEQALIKMVYF